MKAPMKTLRPLAATIAVLLASSTASAFEVNVQSAAGTPTFVTGQLGATTGTNTVSALKSLIANQSAYQANGNEDFKVTEQWIDDLGKQHTRVSQTINGLNVYGASMVVHADITPNQNSLVVNPTANIYAVSGNLAVNADTVKGLSALDNTAASNAANALGEVLGEVELAYVYTPESAKAHLVWKLEVSWDNGDGDFGRDIMFYDARSNELVTRHPQVHSAKSWRTHTLNGGSAQSAPGTLLCTNNQSCGGNAAAQRAHDGASWVYDYYLNKHGRDSLNNAGFALVSSVDMGEQNAYWTGSQMIYGQAGGGVDFDFTSDFDVIGHEFTHGVTSNTANLVYRNESGALNEAWSDIFGVTAEAYRNGTTSSTWLLGDGLYSQPGKAFRYMNNPTKDGRSFDYYPERYTGSSDNGGVHLNSGIANLAYTMLVDGGSHPRGKTTQVVPSIGMAKAEKIFYRALTTYMSANTQFSGARTATKQAAQDLYGATEADAVDAAWCAVGVGSCTTPPPPPPPPPGQELSNGVPVSGVSASQGQDVVYTMDVPAGASNISFAISGGTGDADLYVKFGSTPTDSSYDCRPFADGNSESCTGTQSGGTYYVRVKAYASFSGVTLTGSYGGTPPPPPPPPTGCNGVATWNATTIYLGGNQAAYNGNLYEAKWYTQNENPANNPSNDPWYVWTPLGSCQ